MVEHGIIRLHLLDLTLHQEGRGVELSCQVGWVGQPDFDLLSMLITTTSLPLAAGSPMRVMVALCQKSVAIIATEKSCSRKILVQFSICQLMRQNHIIIERSRLPAVSSSRPNSHASMPNCTLATGEDINLIFLFLDFHPF